MSLTASELKPYFPFLDFEAVEQIVEQSSIQTFEADTEILAKGKYVSVIPFVLDGLIKVYSTYQERELLLYYIEPKQSCTMSFASALKKEPSRIYAVTELKTRVLLLPIDLVETLVDQYTRFNTLFFHQFNQRYSELLDTINHLLFDNLDTRLTNFLKDRMRLTGTEHLQISHKEIAGELGTSREVISRILKKLEHEHVLQQSRKGITFLS